MEPHLINWNLNSINPNLQSYTAPADMREAVKHITELSPLPGITQRILELLDDPFADSVKLAEVVELDPLLTAQVIRWATSSFYGYQGRILSVQDAITRVLGFEYVLNLALGLSMLQPLKAPVNGVLGTKMFWTHALASAKLMKLLSEKMPKDKRPPKQQIFLVALLHNIGFPLFGDQFPEEFAYLSQLVAANPKLVIYAIEKFAFGVDHAALGTWLFNSWEMPKILSDVVYQHHNPFYRGDNYPLNLLAYLNDCLLGQIGIGDAANQTCPEEVLEELGLSWAVCQELIADFAGNAELISSYAEMLTA